MPAPVIGLSCYLEPARWGAWELPAALIPQWYLDLFQRGRRDVVLLPPGSDAGGASTGWTAWRWRAVPTSMRRSTTPSRTTPPTCPARAATRPSSALYRRARDRGMPVLGICRGLQVMAVAHGGSLIQHLPDVPASIVHRERPGAFVEHEARFVDGLAGGARSSAPSPIVVNSSHHQAVESPVTSSSPAGRRRRHHRDLRGPVAPTSASGSSGTPSTRTAARSTCPGAGVRRGRAAARRGAATAA